jgi:hypothetical protein
VLTKTLNYSPQLIIYNMKIANFLILSSTFMLTSSITNANQYHINDRTNDGDIRKIASVRNESKQCRSVIDSLIKEVQQTSGYLGVKRIDVRRDLSKIWSNAPKGDMFDLDIGASQKISWYKDSIKMRKITSKLVKNCPNIVGAVVSIEGDYLYAYGSVNGQINKFACPNSRKSPFRWGYYSGSCY